MTHYILSSDSKTLNALFNKAPIDNHGEFHLLDLNVVIGHKFKFSNDQYSKTINGAKFDIPQEEYVSLLNRYENLLTNRSHYERTLPSGSIKLYYGDNEQEIHSIILQTDNLEDVLKDIPQLDGAIIKEINPSDIIHTSSPTHRPKTNTLSL